MRPSAKSSTSWLCVMYSLAKAVAAASAAQQSQIVTSVFCAELHFQDPIVASVVRADATATEYAIHCGDQWEDGSYGECGDVHNDTMILTVGPSTMAVLGRDEHFTRGFDCRIKDSTTAACDFYLNGTYALERGHFPMDIPDPEDPDVKFEEFIRPLTITAGFEKLAVHQTSSAATSPTPASAATASYAPATQTESTSFPTKSPSQTPSGKSSASLTGANSILALAGLLPALILTVM
ncbi:hypothetical protein NLG97_g2227 [Lecanicillium saksenae]|uniref:Uncharacterized protein n=1 Tax=Lecanicillium saksenae TaxID=468837 RepID=A0ACC1R3C1_9HYPO|nr:hypothetical protein NLG97_g2227 [Lecanicillium saksenae]